MSDQHNTNNNQNTYRSNERSDSFGSNARSAEPNTRVLSDDERRDFDGVTIEEVGDSVHVDSTPTYMDEERQRYTNNIINMGRKLRCIALIVQAGLAASF